jgi:23S rRNA (cytosine1962-C5)-methyltransferase
LEKLRTAGRKFGLIVLDPPRFAGSRRSIGDALRAYHRLNRMAIECLEPCGYLVTCSCSGLVTRSDFAQMISGVAQRTGRDIQVLQQRGASPDHPVLVTCPQTDYLKCFICRVP